VRAEAVKSSAPAFHVVPAIENPHALLAILQRRPSVCAESIDEDTDVIRILHAIGQMVEDAPELARRAGGDDHARAVSR